MWPGFKAIRKISLVGKMYDRYGRGERKKSKNKIQSTSVLSTTEHVCDPSQEAKAGRWLQVQGQLDSDTLSQPPYPEISSRGGGGVSQEPFVSVSVVLICFSFFSLPAGLLTKSGTYSVQWPWLQTRGSWWGSEIAGDCDGRGCGCSSRCWQGAVLLPRQWSAGEERKAAWVGLSHKGEGCFQNATTQQLIHSPNKQS